MGLAGWAMALALAAGAGTAAAQPPYSSEEQAALEALDSGQLINPTRVTVARARAAVRARPRDADAWHELGEALEVAGDVPGAVQAYRRATQLPPRVLGRGYLYRDLAQALAQAGDFRAAVEAARASLRGWPVSRDGLHCAGFEVRLLTRLLVQAHDMEGARGFYRPLYRANPSLEVCSTVWQALGGD